MLTTHSLSTVVPPRPACGSLGTMPFQDDFVLPCLHLGCCPFPSHKPQHSCALTSQGWTFEPFLDLSSARPLILFRRPVTSWAEHTLQLLYLLTWGFKRSSSLLSWHLKILFFLPDFFVSFFSFKGAHFWSLVCSAVFMGYSSGLLCSVPTAVTVLHTVSSLTALSHPRKSGSMKACPARPAFPWMFLVLAHGSFSSGNWSLGVTFTESQDSLCHGPWLFSALIPLFHVLLANWLFIGCINQTAVYRWSLLFSSDSFWINGSCYLGWSCEFILNLSSHW